MPVHLEGLERPPLCGCAGWSPLLFSPFPQLTPRHTPNRILSKHSLPSCGLPLFLVWGRSVFTQKGASQQGLPLLLLLLFLSLLPWLAPALRAGRGPAARSWGWRSRVAAADRECSGSLLQMLLTLLRLQAGLPAPCQHPSAWPPGLLLLSAGWGGTG